MFFLIFRLSIGLFVRSPGCIRQVEKERKRGKKRRKKEIKNPPTLHDNSKSVSACSRSQLLHYELNF